MLNDGLLIMISTVTLCLTNIWIKKSGDKLLFIFWMNLFTYLSMVAIFLLNDGGQGDTTMRSVDFSHVLLDDWPLYVVVAISFLLSMITMGQLFEKYDLSVVYPMTQISLITASAAYMALGDPFHWSIILSIGVVFAGTFITSLSINEGRGGNSGSQARSKASAQLWLLILVQLLCHTTSAAVSYLGTKQTDQTMYVIQGMNHMKFSDVHVMSAYNFNLGSQTFSLAALALYLLSRSGTRARLFQPLRTDKKNLTLGTLAFLISLYAYLIAFGITENTTVLLALNNFSIPLTLAFSYFFLKERVGNRKLLGAALIVIGALTEALF